MSEQAVPRRALPFLGEINKRATGQLQSSATVPIPPRDAQSTTSPPPPATDVPAPVGSPTRAASILAAPRPSVMTPSPAEGPDFVAEDASKELSNADASARGREAPSRTGPRLASLSSAAARENLPPQQEKSVGHEEDGGSGTLTPLAASPPPLPTAGPSASPPHFPTTQPGPARAPTITAKAKSKAKAKAKSKSRPKSLAVKQDGPARQRSLIISEEPGITRSVPMASNSDVRSPSPSHETPHRAPDIPIRPRLPPLSPPAPSLAPALQVQPAPQLESPLAPAPDSPTDASPAEGAPQAAPQGAPEGTPADTYVAAPIQIPIPVFAKTQMGTPKPMQSSAAAQSTPPTGPLEQEHSLESPLDNTVKTNTGLELHKSGSFLVITDPNKVQKAFCKLGCRVIS